MPITPPATRLAELDEQVQVAHAGSQACRSDSRRGAADPLDLLAAAVGHLAVAETLADDVAKVRKQVDRANAARVKAGLTWQHLLEAAGFRVVRA